MDPKRTFRDEVVSDEMAAILRAKTPAERLEISFGMWRLARHVVRSAVKREEPHLNEEEVERAAARRMSHGTL